mgnify:CR=1 FL=1|jgi:putative transcriptional regulator
MNNKRGWYVVAVTYKRLFHLMIDRNISNAELISKAGVSANIFTRMKRNQYIALDSIEKICSVLDCQVDDILEFTSDDGQSKGDVENE